MNRLDGNFISIEQIQNQYLGKISKSVAAACQADYDGSGVKRIKAAIRETEAAIENLWIALEKGQSVDMITERIEKRKAEKAERMKLGLK